MTRTETIEAIKRQTAALKARGATALYVYGSRVRGDYGADSDLDIFIDYNIDKTFSLMDLARIKHLIEDELGLDVHITTHDSLHPMLKDDIERQAVRVF